MPKPVLNLVLDFAIGLSLVGLIYLIAYVL